MSIQYWYPHHVTVISFYATPTSPLTTAASQDSEMEASNSEQYGKVVYKNLRATTLKLYPELLEE